MQVIAPLLVMFSVLVPSKQWYAPDQDILVTIQDVATPVTLVMLDFTGKPVDAEGASDVTSGQTVNLKQYFPQLKSPGTYVLLAVPAGKAPSEFVGTPLVIQVRADTRRDAPPGPMVIKVEPLRYATMTTNQGEMTLIFYYDLAPVTVGSFQRLAEGGYFDGLTFHRIIAGFVIQGGDPRGDGTGGPGYHVEAEFNDRKHVEGALSMARQGDPIEAQGAMPRAEAANSAGSQFFICLNYERTRQLDGRYTVFGQVADGIETVRKLGSVETDKQNDRPIEPQTIQSVKVLPVTSSNNPYARQLNMSAPTTAPAAP